MTEGGWRVLERIDPDAAAFPARARVDGQDVLIFRTEDGYRATQRTCPHQHGNLADGRILGNGAMLRCALHGYTFRLADGKGVNCPGFRIRVHDVVRNGDRLLIGPAASMDTPRART